MKKVVVGIISRKNAKGSSEYLLISSKKDFGKFTGMFYPPGGHLENNEEVKDALVREINEELGVQVDPIRQLAVTSGDVSGQTTYWWQCELVDKSDFNVQDEEINEVRWFGEDNIKKSDKLWPATKSFFEKYILKQSVSTIKIEDFAKIDIRVGRVLEATDVEGSEKLIRQIVDFGEEIGKRVIFSGIKKWYSPADLLGKLLPYVVNLEPRKMMNEESQGMLMAVSSKDENGNEYASLMRIDENVAPGSKVI